MKSRGVQEIGARWEGSYAIHHRLRGVCPEPLRNCRQVALYTRALDVEGAEGLIDVELLSERRSKRTEMVTIYADLDGFTRYVREAENDQDVESLVRTLRMIRREFHCVVEKEDFDGLVLQHQGDCMFGILHLPCGDDDACRAKRRRRAVDIAIGLQSSMEHVLNERLGNRKSIHVAIGLDVGRVLVTRLGNKGKREVVCLGPSVDAARLRQQKSNAKQVHISEDVYGALTDDLVKKQFQKHGASYVATGVTFPSLDRQRQEEAANAGRLGAEVTEDRIRVVTAAPHQTRPWFQ